MSVGEDDLTHRPLEGSVWLLATPNIQPHPSVLFKHFGVTPKSVATDAVNLVQKCKGGVTVPTLAGLA
ncbi:hypothetical protein CspHIS471_0302450 [Cutaneotrichosporon sp. HIS471]|nr:hypothetical protein CspHIS471_0302450 [Cutaneotrichosporon sp. HIS471]